MGNLSEASARDGAFDTRESGGGKRRAGVRSRNEDNLRVVAIDSAERDDDGHLDGIERPEARLCSLGEGNLRSIYKY